MTSASTQLSMNTLGQTGYNVGNVSDSFFNASLLPFHLSIPSSIWVVTSSRQASLMPPPLPDRADPYLSFPISVHLLLKWSHPRAQKVTVSALLEALTLLGKY